MPRERILNVAASSPRLASGPEHRLGQPDGPRRHIPRAGVRDETSIQQKITFLLVFRSDESGYRPSFEGLRSRERWSLQSNYTSSESPSVSVLTTRARLDHAREPVGPGVWPSASSPEAARPSPQEAFPLQSVPRAPPGHTMALRVHVDLCAFVLAGNVWCNVRLLTYVCTMSGLMCHCVVFVFFYVHPLLSRTIF